MLSGYLRQATASQSREVGPFISDSDFKTVQTALTIASTDVKLSANGATPANKNSGGGTHRHNGMYALTFDATDTATVGELCGSISVSGALVVPFKFQVLEEVVFDALFAADAAGFLRPTTAGRTLDVASTGEAGVDFDNIKLTNGAPAVGVTASGTLSGTHSNVSADLGTNAPQTAISKQTLYFPGSNLSRKIDTYNPGTGVATWADPVSPSPANGDAWFMYPTAVDPAGTGGSGGLDAAGVRAAIGMANASFDNQIAAVSTLVNDARSRLPATLIGGRMDSSWGGYKDKPLIGTGAVGDNIRPQGIDPT